LTTVISPTQMGLFQFKFPEEADMDDTFLLTIQNSSEVQVCSILSIQPRPRCPEIHDQERDMRSGSGTQFQTFLGTSALVLRKSRYPDGVHVVLLAQAEDSGCYKKTEPPTPNSSRNMTVRVQVKKLTESKLEATIIILAFYFVICFIAGCISFVTFRSHLFHFDSKFAQREERQRQDRQKGWFTLIVKPMTSLLRAVTGESEVDRGQETEMAIQGNLRAHATMQREAVAAREVDSEVEAEVDETTHCCGSEKNTTKTKAFKFCWQEEEEDTTNDATDGAAVSRTHTITQEHVRERHASGNTTENTHVKKVVTLDKKKIKARRVHSDVKVADMAVCANPEYFKNFLWQRSEQFVWNVFIVGIYYTLPVFQLVLYYQNVSLEKGDMDTCYYNFRCLYPWGNIADYGHVFSNIGYIICGLFFNFIVWNRKRKYTRFCKSITEDKCLQVGEVHPKHLGIPESYGILYAMGGALIMEGVLSGCYHICPTAENFQFDTTFMYAIAVLVFLKVYQFRHTDITSTGHFVFMWIGVALFFEMLGYFTEHWFFWIVFVVIYLFFVLAFVVHVYFHATGPRNLLKAIRSKESYFKYQKKGRLIPTILIVVVNICVATFIALQRKAGVSRYLLVILMANMMLYIGYYICHKLYFRLRCKRWLKSEGFRPITLIYLLLMMAMGLPAVWFFKTELKTSAGTAAESRNLNADCFMLIFDNHDMWHFFSASSLFFLFMFIMTIEDYNKEKPRQHIPVF